MNNCSIKLKTYTYLYLFLIPVRLRKSFLKSRQRNSTKRKIANTQMIRASHNSFISFIGRICIALISIMQIQNCCVWCSPKTTNGVCTTRQCQVLATAYLRNMNHNADPCTNFYDYVCHSWEHYNPKPELRDVFNIEGILQDKALKELKTHLEDTKVSSRESEEKAKVLYKACLNLPTMERRSAAALQRIMEKIGNWPMLFPKYKLLPPNFAWWKLDMEYSKLSGESALFEFYIALSATPERRPLIRLGALESPYGMLKRRNGWNSLEEKGYYKDFLRNIILSLAPKDFENRKDKIDEDLENVLSFRDSLREIGLLTVTSPVSETSIKTFSTWSQLTSMAHRSVIINWLQIVRSITKNGIYVDGSMVVDVSTIQTQNYYFSELDKLLGKTLNTVIANHIHLYFAERHLILSSAMKEALKSSRNYSQTSGKIRYDIPRWQWCIDNHFMEVTLRKMFIRNSFSKKDKTAVQKLVDKSKELFIQQMNESTWLDDITKQKTSNKISKINGVIGYPPFYTKCSTSEDCPHALDPLRSDDIYYTVKSNELHMSAAALQWPTYSPNVPYVIDYGATVSTIGHELYHAVDSDGILYDGEAETPWWSEAMVKKYHAHAQCFKDQYQNYRKKVFEKYNNKRDASELPSTLNEDMADVMGLTLAYRGLKQKIAENKGNCPILPGFENKGCEQLFFIAFGNTFCSKNTPNGELRLMLFSVHSRPYTRLNGAVANLKGFATAFDCQPKDPLNLEEKCYLWK